MPSQPREINDKIPVSEGNPRKISEAEHVPKTIGGDILPGGQQETMAVSAVSISP